MKIKIYFWKHGFQTDGVSLWVVQQGRLKWLTENVICNLSTVSKFQNKNPHAYMQTVAERVEMTGKGLRHNRMNNMPVFGCVIINLL